MKDVVRENEIIKEIEEEIFKEKEYTDEELEEAVESDEMEDWEEGFLKGATGSYNESE